MVSEWTEHSPGSFVVRLGSISALLDAPRRRRDRSVSAPAPRPESIKELDQATLELLRRLAIRSLEALGVRDTEKFVESEMLSKFNSLAASIAAGPEGEERLRGAIRVALEHLDD